MKVELRIIFTGIIIAVMLTSGIILSLHPMEIARATEGKQIEVESQQVQVDEEKPSDKSNEDQNNESIVDENKIIEDEVNKEEVSDNITLEASSKVLELKMVDEELTLTVGDSKKINIIAVMSDESEQDVTNDVDWDIDNDQVVTINKGEWKAIGEGIGIVTATYEGHEIQINVTVKLSDNDQNENLPEETNDENLIKEEVSIEPLAVTLFEVTVEQGESIEFHNLSNYSYAITTNGSVANNRIFDSAVYKSDGTGMNQQLDSALTSKTVPAGGKMVVTVLGSPVTFNGREDAFTYYSTTSPALLKKTVSKGEGVHFINNGDVNENLTITGSSTQKYSYQSINDDQSVYSEIFNTTAVSPIVPAKGDFWAEVTSDTPVTFAGYYEIFQEMEVTKPILYNFQLAKGNSFQFVNETTGYQKIDIVASSTEKRIYDYAIYNNTGGADSFDKGAVATSRSVLAGGRIVVTTTSDNPVSFQAFRSNFAGSVQEEPALFEKAVAQNETIHIRNVSNKNTAIKITASTSRRFSYQLVNSEGTVTSQVFDSAATSLTIPAEGKLIATVTSAEPISFYGYYDVFQEENAENALLIKTLSSGQVMCLLT